MSIVRLMRRLRSRRQRSEYRSMVRRWNADGGDERWRFDYPLQRESLVLDLGGYEGQWASDLYSRYRCRVVVFEPVRAFAERIRERFKHNDDIEVMHCGLGGASRTETIHLRGAGSSLHKGAPGTEEVRIVDVTEWLASRNVASVQLLKINIEGGEYELLERLLATGLIDAIDSIQVQFHYLDAGSPGRMEAIQRGLARTHMPTYQYRFVWENWARKRSNGGPRCATS